MKDQHLGLDQILAQHEGKVTDKWSLYLRTYEELFAPMRHDRIKLLEIGVQNGGSLEIWAKYFKNAKIIVGNDIASSCGGLSFEDERIRVIVANAISDRAGAAIRAISNTFNVIIDDGSHVSADIIGAFARYFPALSYGGYYIIEDLHCSYWEEYGGGLYDPYSSVSFLKRLADVVNAEHWGTASSRSDLLSAFTQKYNIELSEDVLSCVHSVSFINSICIIRKSEPSDAVLGPRMVRGKVADVNPRLKDQDGTTFVADEQSNNIWSRTVPIEPLYENAIDQIDCFKKLTAAEFSLKRISHSLLAHLANHHAGKANWFDRLRSRFSDSYAGAIAKQWEIELVRESGLFDEAYYLERYPDVAEAGTTPIMHYLLHGSGERRNPNPNFDAKFYASRVEDQQLQGLSQLTHYILVGSIGGLSTKRGE